MTIGNIIGYAASLFIVLSFLIKDNLLYIRLTNLVGCVKYSPDIIKLKSKYDNLLEQGKHVKLFSLSSF